MRSRSRAVPLVVLAALIVVSAVAGLVFSGGEEMPECPVGAAAVVLDPGHGGEDPGAVNEALGLVERELVLAISRRAAHLLRAEGYSVALTREDDATGLGNSERGLIANACSAFAYVSVHLNSFGEPDPNYVRTFWATAETDLRFADVMQVALVAELGPGTDLEDGGLEQLENGGLLRARMPAVLVEPVFLSHPAEAARLATGERQEAIARAIARGVATWFGPGIADGQRAPEPRRVGQAPVTERDVGLLGPNDALLGPARGAAERVMEAAEEAGAERLPEVRAYVAEVYRLAPLVGLDPAILVAQSAHETGYWRSAAWAGGLNPAGIGVTGPGVASPRWASGEEAARAHVVHLYLYAVGEVASGHELAPYVALDPRYGAAMGAGRAGIARTVADLAGRWATDLEYAAKVARAGNELFQSN